MGDLISYLYNLLPFRGPEHKHKNVWSKHVSFFCSLSDVKDGINYFENLSITLYRVTVGLHVDSCVKGALGTLRTKKHWSNRF